MDAQGRFFVPLVFSVLSLFEISAFVISLSLLALKKTDATTTINVVLVLILSLTSSLLTGRQLYAYISISSRPKYQLLIKLPPKYELVQSAARYLAFLWLIPTILGLVIAIKQPVCSSDSTLPVWKQGVGCGLHRTLVALSLTILLTRNLLRRLTKPQIQPSPCVQDLLASDKSLAASTASVTTIEKPEQMYLIPEPLSATKYQQRYLQRRNSISSQRAVYPYGRSTIDQPRSTSLGYPPSSRYARSTIRSVSDLESVSSDRPSTSRTSISNPSSSSSVYSRRLRAGLDPNCPAIPESPRSNAHDTSAAAPTVPAAPPPAWCPPLRHAPLSADPAIRALTVTNVSDAQNSSGSSLVQSMVWPVPPKLPVRALGHTAVGRVSTGTRMGLRRPSPIRYRQQRLWSYGNLSGVGIGNGGEHCTAGGGKVAAGGNVASRVRPSVYSVSSYGTSLRGSSAYGRL